MPMSKELEILIEEKLRQFETYEPESPIDTCSAMETCSLKRSNIEKTKSNNERLRSIMPFFLILSGLLLIFVMRWFDWRLCLGAMLIVWGLFIRGGQR